MWASIYRTLTGVALGLSLVALLLGAAPALASLHTYHERPGQTTHRSIQSLPDRQGLSWQAVLFRRYPSPLEGPTDPQIDLRLVGFPGQVRVDRQRPLTIQTGTSRHWQAHASAFRGLSELPENVAQYDVEAILGQLTGPAALTLAVPLQGGRSVDLIVAPFVVKEWLETFQRQSP
ncbi:MAG: DUF3122 domain-containing protein [Cyanobacteriota bacterium]|nr:DUF3122 domain-containing protein [Cyanobacteriota bacterium]